jgi:hypothetical protein
VEGVIMSVKPCYNCGKNDCVSTVAEVISANTSYSETHGAVYDWSVNSFVGISTADYQTTSTTPLGRKFALPSNPGKPGLDNYLLYWALGVIPSIIFLANYFGAGEIETFFVWLYVVIFACGFAVILGAVGWVAHSIIGIPASMRWNSYRESLLNSYYCYSCDLAFDDTRMGGPGNYIEDIFTGNRTKITNKV